MNERGRISNGGVAAAAEVEEEFSTCVGSLLMAAEELRRSLPLAVSASSSSEQSVVQTHHVVQWQQEMDGLLPLLDTLQRHVDDYGMMDASKVDLFRHCQQKAISVAQQAFECAIKLKEPDPDDPNLASSSSIEEVRQTGQGAIARMAEVNLLLLEQSAIATSRSSTTPVEQSNNNKNNNDIEEKRAADSIVQSYVSYQRQVLRQRAKPAIARLVQARRDGIMSTSASAPPISSVAATPPFSSPISHQNNHNNENDDDGDDDDEGTAADKGPVIEQHHAPVLASIMGQAAALIHPLLVWNVNLMVPEQQQELNTDNNAVNGNDKNAPSPPAPPPRLLVQWLRRMCVDAVATIDEQAQSLAQTVSEWFWQDRPMDQWMERTTTHDDEQQQHLLSREELGILDGLVEEIAFGCQVQARYCSLLIRPPDDQESRSQNNNNNNNTTTTIIESQLLPEWTWKYATLERFLATQQWQSALMLASPVHIVINTAIQVPSVVEDAQYLSTRALQRAASTQSVQAIGTVAHAVSHDVWSTEMTGGIHQALMEHRGCWIEPVSESKKDENTTMTTPAKSGFASALLDALDEDLGPARSSSSSKPTGSPPNKLPSAPSSGNFLTAFVGGGGDNNLQMQLDTELCILNGIHAAAGACSSLVNFLDSLLLAPDDDDDEAITSSGSQRDEKAMALIQLAREELFRYAESYQQMLTQHIQQTLAKWCGTVVAPSTPRGGGTLIFDYLRSFLEHEEYYLDVNSFAMAELDERLERDLIDPLQQSRLLSQLSYKCEPDVLRQIGDAIVPTLVELILKVLWEGDKKFTDWGSLLLSKQVRLLQNSVTKILSPQSSDGPMPSLLEKWERLSQVVTVLQLEKPSDWLAYESILSPEELSSTLSLRVDFSSDARHAVVAQVSKTAVSDSNK